MCQNCITSPRILKREGSKTEIQARLSSILAVSCGGLQSQTRAHAPRLGWMLGPQSGVAGPEETLLLNWRHSSRKHY